MSLTKYEESGCPLVGGGGGVMLEQEEGQGQKGRM